MRNPSGRILSILVALLNSAIILCSGSVVAQNQSEQDQGKKTIVEMSADELLHEYPIELADLEFSPIQGGLDSLLKTVGGRVQSFFSDFSNTSSRERVLLQILTPNGKVLRSSKKEYYYLIFPAKTGLQWKEERTDKKGRPINLKAMSPTESFCISSGYAHVSIYLHPTYQPSSLFRYLGRTVSGTHVIGFAQKRDGAPLASYTNAELSVTVPFLVQGLVWIDPDNYQITRMRTGMLSPNMFLRKQMTDISYTEVSFDGVKQPFWLPHQVTVMWELPGQVIFRNQHSYSDYRLFSVESEYSISKPTVR